MDTGLDCNGGEGILALDELAAEPGEYLMLGEGVRRWANLVKWVRTELRGGEEWRVMDERLGLPDR